MKIKRYYFFFIILGFLFNNELLANTQYYRLSYRDDPATTVVVCWCDNGVSTNARVYFGTTDYGTNYLSYPQSHGIDRSALNYYGLNHRFSRLTQLTPNTVYYFVVRDDQGISARMCFKTLPDNANSPITFISGGDSRTTASNEPYPDSLTCRPNRQNANRLVGKISPDFVAISGDYVLKGPTIPDWENWFADWQLSITPEGRLFPLIPVLGNHEEKLDLYNMFDIPDSNSYYSLSIAGNLLRIYTLNTDIGLNEATFKSTCDSTQRSWLENDLQLHTGNINEPYWKFVQYHSPFAPHACFPVDTVLINCWAPLFQTYKVKLAAEAHAHVIKQTWPIITSSDPDSDNGFIRNDSCGIVYIGDGSWGAPMCPLFTHYSPNAAFEWTRNQAQMPGFQLVCVSKEKIEVRTIMIDSITNVGQVGLHDPPCTLPANIAIWNPSNGSVITINNPNPDGIREIPAGKTAVIYPNPANKVIHIDFLDKNNNAKVEVYNAYGLRFKSLSVSTNKIMDLDISSLASGIYYIYIIMNKFSESYKISIVR